MHSELKPKISFKRTEKNKMRYKNRTAKRKKKK